LIRSRSNFHLPKMNSTQVKLAALNQRTNAANSANKQLGKINAKIDAKEKEIAQITETATGALGTLRAKLVKQLKALADIQLPIMIELENLVDPVATPVEGGEKS